MNTVYDNFEHEPLSDADCSLASELFENYYDELKAIARANRRRKRLGDTFETTEVLHSAYFKIASTEHEMSEDHFKSVVTLAIRQVIVDYARKKLAQKRGGGMSNVPLADVDKLLPEFSETPEDMVLMSQLMEKLEQTNPRWLRVLDARFFSGMTEEETAQILNVNVRTIRRDWQSIKAWLAPGMGAA